MKFYFIKGLLFSFLYWKYVKLVSLINIYSEKVLELSLFDKEKIKYIEFCKLLDLYVLKYI